MTRVRLIAAVAVLVAVSTGGGEGVRAQSGSEQQQLRRQIERRFYVLPLSGGVALRPKDDDRGVRSIELRDGTIAIDGTPATGPEVRDKLGPDADLVFRLSYLDAADRQRLFATTSPAPPIVAPPPSPPEPPALPEAPEPPNPPDRARRRIEGGDRVRFGGSVTVDENDEVSGDAVAIGGTVRVDGRVNGNAVAIGGSLLLGPHADVVGDAVSVGGSIRRDPGARIGGKVVEVGPGFDFSQWGSRFPHRRWFPFGFPLAGAAFGAFSLMATLARVAILSALVSLVLLMGREYVERVGERASAEPLKAGAIGFLAQVLFLPILIVTCVLLVVTIIGIPLLVLIPFAILGLAIVGLIGFTAVSYDVGRLVNQRLGWIEQNPYLTAITGIVVLLSPLLIARLLGLADWLLFPITGTLAFLGYLVEYLAWTIGFGAVALLRFARPGTAPATGTISAPGAA